MLEIKNISYQAKKQLLLEAISFIAKKGSITGILGANGAGKSTLLKIIGGEYANYNGQIFLNGKLLSNCPGRLLSQQRATISQHESVNGDIKVIEYILLGRLAHSNSKYTKTDYLSVSNAMQITDIARFRYRRLLSLSGGERQRVQLARALVQLDGANGYAGYLLLDEFNSNMDIYHQHASLALLKKLCSTYDLGVLIIGHDLNLALEFFDSCILLKGGRLVANGASITALSPANIKMVFNLATQQVKIGDKNFICHN